jgi:hypothetical protein
MDMARLLSYGKKDISKFMIIYSESCLLDKIAFIYMMIMNYDIKLDIHLNVKYGEQLDNTLFRRQLYS